MSDLKPFILEEEDGTRYSMIVEYSEYSELSLPEPIDDDRESYGLQDEITVKLKDVHDTIRGYAKYALGAFKDLGDAQVEEICLKFNLKVSGKSGFPILAEGSAEGSFEVQVKCKFPDISQK
ncbi:CU044_2847 family protein [Oscillatoria sp. CS-180]|uniref:CU044_2847 family protein n=1 Tax=Oscillatoria sp. CS-180 TaxID=3021720 RepID=UPI00232F751B|nr:CU044_2847 family protein [Oscillatoria sp. CS-180]MDB9529604.1 CU044_2847 family protein [Oscillatoria sp. CS-180]